MTFTGKKTKTYHVGNYDMHGKCIGYWTVTDGYATYTKTENKIETLSQAKSAAKKLIKLSHSQSSLSGGA